MKIIDTKSIYLHDMLMERESYVLVIIKVTRGNSGGTKSDVLTKFAYSLDG